METQNNDRRLKALFDYSSHIELSIAQNAGQLNHLHPAALPQHHQHHHHHTVQHPASLSVPTEPNNSAASTTPPEHFIAVEHANSTVHHRGHAHAATGSSTIDTKEQAAAGARLTLTNGGADHADVKKTR